MTPLARTVLHKRPFLTGESQCVSSYRGTHIRRVWMCAQASKHLLIVGPGVLGTYLGKLWLDSNPGSSVIGQTNTTNNHERLAKVGLVPVTKKTLDPSKKFSHVAFCAPPSGSEDYPGEVKAALARWDGSGNFVFTSSTRTLQKPLGGVSNEDTPPVQLGKDPYLDKLVNTEKAVLEAQGCVMRLVGLYHRTRGAHTYFIKLGKVQRDPQFVVNLIHYEDAARIVQSVLDGKGSVDGLYRSKQFLGSDNNPVTFQDMMDACFNSGVFSGCVEFTVPPGDKSKYPTVNNDVTRAQLQWQPKYPSFMEFMNSGANDFYHTSGLF